jgi:hypothetical protein
VTFDGFGLHTPEAEMLAGIGRDGPTQPLAADLEIECVTPAWDARTASALASGAGAMEQQSWASEHYEQLVRATGTVTLATGSVPFSGYGWRDHSRGPRHASLGGWGGHVILGCVYPESGRAWGLSRYYTASGSITLEGGYVYAGGKFEHARVVTAPRLLDLRYEGEVMPVALEWSGGRLELSMHCDRSLWTSMQRSLAVGKDLTGPGLMYVLSHGRCEWGGETGIFYSERSDQLNALAPEPHYERGP